MYQTIWSSILVKKVNDVKRLQALVDRKKVIITKATIQEVLRLDDTESKDFLPNEEIFIELSRMGYEKPSTKLTFYKAFFLPQWKFLIHTILQCMSTKRTSWNEFSSSMASTVICLSSSINFSKFIFDSLERNVDSSTKFYMYPRFLQLMIRAQVGDLSSHTTKYSFPALTQKVFANMRRVGKGFSRVETPLFEGIIVAQQADDVADEGTAGVDVDVVPAAAEPFIPSLHLLLNHHHHHKNYLPLPKRKNKLRVSELRRLRKVGTAQRVESSGDTIIDDVSKQGEIIATMDADKDVTLKDVAAVAKEVELEKDAEIEENADVQGRQAVSQAQIYKIDLEHADKVLSMQDDDATITAANTLIIAAILTAAPSAARRRKGVVIKDLEETAASSIILHTKPKSKDKGKWIMVEEPKPLKKKEKEDNVVMRYQALKRKPQTEAQARKNMMIYLRNMAGFKIDYFKGISYDDIRPIFDKALKRASENQAEKAAKKHKLDEEVEELKKHLQIVPNDGDDVYSEATPLARKVPVVDYEIYTENNKPYYKIIRADGLPSYS
nr:hypothetical protein [Tanacetum cinerariifolium]